MEQLAVVPAALEEPVSTEKLVFNASGGEYFRIWIVNVLLSIVTLGIYSAWAKVRRTQYFYSSTTLAGSSFEYHGAPLAILKGRIAALILFGAYNIAFRYSPKAGFAMMALMAAVMPWLIWKSLQFRLYNSSYRAIRFGFGGSAGQAYLQYLLLPLMCLLTGLVFMAPFAHQRLKRFQHGESRFGTGRFGFDAGVGSFYKAYLLFALALVPLLAALYFVASALLAPGAMAPPEVRRTADVASVILALYGALVLGFPLFMTMIQNLIWNHTTLEGHRFESHMKWTRLAFIVFTNLVAIVVTLGLFIPFAHVRLLKYRLESMRLVVHGSLDAFVADTAQQVGAAGEGMLDLLDFDLSM